MKKEEVKEEGAASKHIRVVYSNKRKRTVIYLLAGLSFLIIAVSAFSYIAIDPRLPQFVLDDLYVNPVVNSSVMVKLSSTNPSHKSSIYYSKMRVHVWMTGDFETENVNLESRHQKPREVTTWTAVVATNSNNNNNNVIREGVTNGEIITDLSIKWKCGIFLSSKFGMRIKCPVLLNLEDLSSAVSTPMSPCHSSL